MDYEKLNESLLKGKKDKFFVSIVPVTEFGEVLIGRRTEDGIWTTPGGGADPGEEPHEAARRELFEEAGLAAPANSLELVSIGETPRGFKIYSFLWRLPKAFGEMATSRLDPDKEVKTWKLLRPDSFPAAMSEEKNASRLKTIREALMRLYAVKSEDHQIDSLVDKLNKGGPGSGQAGHMTAKKPGIAKPGAQEVPQVNKVQQHLDLLRHGSVLPGVHTASGKPIVTNMDAAKAQGYGIQDYVDAMNVHYNMAQKVNGAIEKMKMAGKKVPKEALEIAKFHEKQMKANMSARDHLEDQEKTLKEHKKKAVKKSVTQMGSGLGDRDLDVGSFAQTQSKADDKWMETLHTGMSDYNFGDEPRDFQTPKGVLHLCKVDDGIYSGFFTNQQMAGDGMLEDNAKVRIERMTIPELVMFMMAKEWIVDHLVAEPEKPQEAPQVVQPDFSALEQKLSQPVIPSPSISSAQFENNEQRIRMLELVTKLLG